jgi:hypothetical protein
VLHLCSLLLSAGLLFAWLRSWASLRLGLLAWVSSLVSLLGSPCLGLWLCSNHTSLIHTDISYFAGHVGLGWVGKEDGHGFGGFEGGAG